MLDMRILGLTAGLLGLIFFGLTFWVMKCRAKTRLMLGDGSGTELPGAKALQIAVRAHANFTEYVPLILILLAWLAYAGTAAWFLAALCAALVLGRVLHPLGMPILRPNPMRAIGAMLTWAVLAAASIACIVNTV